MKMTVQAAHQQNNIKDAVAVLLQFKQGNNMSLREFAKLPGRIISQMKDDEVKMMTSAFRRQKKRILTETGFEPATLRSEV